MIFMIVTGWAVEQMQMQCGIVDSRQQIELQYRAMKEEAGEEKEEFKIGEDVPQHRKHIQSLALSLLRESKVSSKSETLILTSRANSILTSILTDPQIYSCGYNRIVLSKEVISNPYLTYDDAVLALSFTSHPLSYHYHDFSPCPCSDELMKFAHQVNNVTIINLNISGKRVKDKMKSFEFRPKAIKGYYEENLDFIAYLNNAYTLYEGIPVARNVVENDEKMKSQILETSIERLVSFLLADEIGEIEVQMPERMGMSSRRKTKGDSDEFRRKMKEAMEEKLGLLEKYKYKHYSKVNKKSILQKTKVIILEREEDLSPFILSLNYGAIVEELNLAKINNMLSVHSYIYNQLYYQDLLRSGELLLGLSEIIKSSNKNNISAENFKETKKVLLSVYNPNLSKEEVMTHQSVMKQANQFAEKNKGLLILQQSIANGIDENGREMRGSRILDEIFSWVERNKEKGYEKYLGLVLMGFLTHDFWWFQRSDLVSAVEKDHQKAIQDFYQNCKANKVYHLQELPPHKDQNNQDQEIRMQCFRHEPQILKQYKKWKQQPTKSHTQTLIFNKQGKTKKTRTVVYLNCSIGYGELAMLMKMNEDVEWVCRDLKNCQEWLKYQSGLIK